METLEVDMDEGPDQDGLIEAFRTFDDDGNGFISAAKLRHITAGMGGQAHRRGGGRHDP